MNGLVPAISKIANEMDKNVSLNDVPRGIKTVLRLNKEINEKEQLKNSQQNPEKEEKVPTGSEIREAVIEGMYR